MPDNISYPKVPFTNNESAKTELGRVTTARRCHSVCPTTVNSLASAIIRSMYVVTLVLFSVPCFLMLSAWSRALKTRQAAPKPDWRIACLVAALVAGSCTIAAGLSFVFAWLYAGGNPHGMGTPPGISQVLRWVFWSAFLGTIGLTLLAREIFILAAIVSAVLADLAAMLSDFD